MTERAPARGGRAKAGSTASIHFRMPARLRSRLRHFAEERSLGESEALRLAVSERLNQVDEERELAAAERWQFEHAWATWQRIRRGTEKLVTPDEMHRRLDHAVAQERAVAPQRRTRGPRKGA